MGARVKQDVYRVLQQGFISVFTDLDLHLERLFYLFYTDFTRVLGVPGFGFQPKALNPNPS